MTERDAMRDQIAGAIWDERADGLPLDPDVRAETMERQAAYCRRLADAVIAALNLTAGTDPIGLSGDTFITGRID